MLLLPSKLVRSRPDFPTTIGSVAIEASSKLAMKLFAPPPSATMAAMPIMLMADAMAVRIARPFLAEMLRIEYDIAAVKGMLRRDFAREPESAASSP